MERDEEIKGIWLCLIETKKELASQSKLIAELVKILKENRNVRDEMAE